ncbi:hypothetical protein ACET3X_005631 [Alternaria dauci]|uniref:Uncharacterized protein n=1 Tax=Alternaria dauci TaxID=48095 RepID=A0ABR3UGR8_9PLEO
MSLDLAQQNDSDYDNSSAGEEDGLYQDVQPDEHDREPDEHDGEEYHESSLGDEDAIANNQLTWAIDHSGGDHRLPVKGFIKMIDSPEFNGSKAIGMLQKRYTIDYGSRRVGSRPAKPEDKFIPEFHLDLIIIIGRPLQPIVKFSTFFDHVTISFKHWRAPYSAKHSHGLSFDMEHRTFRLAKGGTRESWFIVMHPVDSTVDPLLSGSERRKRREKASEHSALKPSHALFLTSYIKKVFLTGVLLGEGVEASWKLDGPQSQSISIVKWETFQEQFMEGWPEYVRKNTQDPFWTENLPAFHAYDYGQNLPIELSTEQLNSLPKETRLRPDDETSDSDDETSDSDDETSDSDSETSDSGNDLSNSGNDLPNSQNDLSNSEDAAARSEGGAEGATPPQSGTQTGDPIPPPHDHQQPFDNYTQDLLRALEDKYRLESIETVSYALAVDIHSIASSNLPNASNDVGVILAPARCLLANRNNVVRQYQHPRDFTFYPLAFHPSYGNFSSAQPPAFLRDNVLAVMEDNMSYQNNGASVLTSGYFQAYSNIKRTIRHSPGNLLATKGIATAALTLPDQDGNLNPRVAAKRQRLLRKLRGEQTPDNPTSSQPFAREQQRIKAAIKEELYAFRMEQVLSVQVSQLADGQRNFATVLQPILQLIRYFSLEQPTYIDVLFAFKERIFPKVLSSFASLFAHASDEFYRRFKAAGSKGLPFALAEGVAAFDRLGSYCFTGFPRSLVGSVLGPLCTIESIEQGGWPFIDPNMLNLQGSGHANLVRWPRMDNGRPIMMHVASIRHHYGPQVAAYCHSEVWFRELGGLTGKGPRGAEEFLVEVLEEMWKPQTIAFVTHQFYRALNKGGRGNAQSVSLTTLQARQEAQEQVTRWAESEHPFSAGEYESIFPVFYPEATSGLRSQTRRDFAQELYWECVNSHGQSSSYLFSKNASWFTVLRAAVQHARAKAMKEEYWISAIMSALAACRIDCVPGSYHGRLSYRRMTRLVGNVPAPSAIAARPGSLKRAAIEAVHQAKRRSQTKSTIDFGCQIPFNAIPPLVEKGFQQLDGQFSKSGMNQKDQPRTLKCLRPPW